MSKRGRKEQKAAQLSKQNAVETTNDQPIKSTSIDNDEQQTNEVKKKYFLFCRTSFFFFLEIFK
jgi:hypothetical protein